MPHPTASLFDALTVGAFRLPHRMIMAPLTRGRALPDGTPTPIMAEYYRQRASAGLIVTEATSISPQGVGWLNAPGIFTDAHVEGWKPVTAAVHESGGRIVLQLWHMGRVSHPDFLDGELPVGPSALAADGESHTPLGKKPYVTPRALAADELPGIAADYVRAAQRALAAGFDGVEIHGANGYLLDQFIRDRSNRRDDAYGGPVEARWRFPLEVARAVVGAVGADRVGFRVSPTSPFNDMDDANPLDTYGYGAAQLSGLGLAYMHVIEPLPGHFMARPNAPAVLPRLRADFGGALIANGGYDLETGNALLRKGHADAVAFGIPFLANPDLPLRYQQGAALNEPRPDTFYTPGPDGYTDYPSL